MVSILNNVTAMAASRQLGISQMGLKQAIQRLTTGKRINSAADDAAGMVAGTGFTAQAKTAGAQVKGYQNTYFAASAQDAYLEEATTQAMRLAELEGSGNTSSAEYTAVLGLANAASALGGDATVATDSASALTAINAQRQTLSATMATAQSNANIKGIEAENASSQADNIMGADVGAEMVNLTKYQILMQAGTSALTQANQSSQTILRLFQ